MQNLYALPDSPALDHLRPGWEKLLGRLGRLKQSGMALAFSGGLDSMILLQICCKMNLDVLALHFTGPHLSAAHSRQAVRWLAERNIPHKTLEHPALSIPQVRNSDARRCYYCKQHIFGVLKQEAGTRALCDGTNAGDFKDYRPGMAALREHGVLSPFAESGLGKPQIKAIAKILNLDAPPYSAQNCLLTRFAYGLQVTAAQLDIIERAENTLRPLLMPSLKDEFNAACMQGGMEAKHADRQYRLRYVGGVYDCGAVRAELHVEGSSPLPQNLRQAIAGALSSCGLENAPIVLMPVISGYFDQNINRQA